jgi:hypothetical protein
MSLYEAANAMARSNDQRRIAEDWMLSERNKGTSIAAIARYMGMTPYAVRTAIDDAAEREDRREARRDQERWERSGAA